MTSSTSAGQQVVVALPRGRRFPRRSNSRPCLNECRRLPTVPAGSQRLVELRNTINLTGGTWDGATLAATLLATTSGSP